MEYTIKTLSFIFNVLKLVKAIHRIQTQQSVVWACVSVCVCVCLWCLYFSPLLTPYLFRVIASIKLQQYKCSLHNSYNKITIQVHMLNTRRYACTHAYTHTNETPVRMHTCMHTRMHAYNIRWNTIRLHT